MFQMIKIEQIIGGNFVVVVTGDFSAIPAKNAASPKTKIGVSETKNLFPNDDIPAHS
jgi:microcompartment protein CcmL/EutN